jgi:hypothetical protein
MMPRNPPGVGEPRHRSAVVGLISCDDVIVPVTRHRHRVVAKTSSPAATSAATHGPRSVSMPTFTRAAAVTGSSSAQSCGTIERPTRATPRYCPALRAPAEPPTAVRPRRRPPRHDDLQPSRHRRTTSSSPFPPSTPTSAARRRQQRSNGQVLTANVARHPSSSSIPSRPAGARSAHRPQRAR